MICYAYDLYKAEFQRVSVKGRKRRYGPPNLLVGRFSTGKKFQKNMSIGFFVFHMSHSVYKGIDNGVYSVKLEVENNVPNYLASCVTTAVV